MVALDQDWLALSPAERLVTMPTFPMDGTIPTLGVGVIEWMRGNLVQPDGPRAGKSFVPSPDQIDFLLWFYALDEQARWLFNLGVRRLSKGKGKSPFAAALSLTEYLGPVRLDRFDDRVPGGCVGLPVAMPLVQIVAAAESQTKNTMRYVRAFCPRGGRLAREYGIDVGKTQFYKLPEGTLEVITSSFTAAEGAQSTFAVGDEPEHWTPANQGDQLNSTILDNLTKTGGRMVHTCNAWVPGAGSVAEDTWDDWVAQEEGGLRGDQRILYDARVAPPDTDMSDRDSMMRALEHCYEGSPWVDLENVLQRVWRKSAKPEDSKRKYLNWPSVPSDAWVTPHWWSLLARTGDDAVEVDPEEPVVLFFDGSKSRDATALVGCTVEAGHVFTLGVWEPDPAHDSDETVNTAEVDMAVRKAFGDLHVVAFFADVREWEQFALTTWPQDFGDRLKVWAAPASRPPQPVAWDMRGHQYEFAKATEACHAEILDGAFTHDGHPAVARHVANARRRPYRDALAIGKESPDSRRKIDAAVCVIGARMVRRIALGSGKRLTKRTGRAAFV